LSQNVEPDEIGNEEESDPIDQLDSVDLAGKRTVERRDNKQQERMPGGSVAFHFGPVPGQNEGLAHRLDNQIGAQENKQIEHEKNRSHSLSFTNLGEQSEKTFEHTAPFFLHS
jgi:hypothetical protein